MKKVTAIILALLLCLTLFACGEDPAASAAEPAETAAPTEAPAVPTEPAAQYVLGETVATDIVEFTLDRADLAIALENTYGDTYCLPKEYSASEDSDNPYVAPIGSTLVAITYTATNLDRGSLDMDGAFNGYLFSAAYGDFSQALETHYGMEFTAEGQDSYNSSNVLLSAGETAAYRCYLEAGFDAADLNDDFALTVTLPTSSGSSESFTYHITAADRTAAAQQTQAEKDAKDQAAQDAMDDLLSEADPEVANAVKEFLQGSWEYSVGYADYELVFDGDDVSVTAIAGGYALTNEGTFTVCKGAVLITYENGGQAIMRYTYENGETEIFPIEGIE